MDEPPFAKKTGAALAAEPCARTYLAGWFRIIATESALLATRVEREAARGWYYVGLREIGLIALIVCLYAYSSIKCVGIFKETCSPCEYVVGSALSKEFLAYLCTSRAEEKFCLAHNRFLAWSCLTLVFFVIFWYMNLVRDTARTAERLRGQRDNATCYSHLLFYTEPEGHIQQYLNKWYTVMNSELEFQRILWGRWSYIVCGVAEAVGVVATVCWITLW